MMVKDVREKYEFQGLRIYVELAIQFVNKGFCILVVGRTIPARDVEVEELT